MNFRTAVLIAVLAVAAAASWYLTRHNRGAATPQPQNIVNRGYYLKSARILGTGPDGTLLYEIRADRAQQKADESIEFTDVSVRYSPQSDVPWTLSADSAIIATMVVLSILSAAVPRTEPRNLCRRDRRPGAHPDRVPEPQCDRHVSIAQGESTAAEV